MNQSSVTRTLYQGMQEHPVCFTGFLCLVCAGLFRQGENSFFTPAAPYLLGAAALLTLFLWGVPSLRRIGIVVLCAGLAATGCLLLSFAPNPAVILLLLGMVTLLAVALGLWFLKKLTVRSAAFLLLAAGFLLRLCYVLYTGVSIRQHDVWNFSAGDFTGFTHQRHAEYIEYIAAYLRLPAVDPTKVGLSQLYHPPLHHLIAGLWLRLNTVLGVPYSAATENIQLLTLFYSSACMVIAYRIFRTLKLQGFSLLLPMAVICFHPTFILMAGSVNNDLLSITLSLYALLWALRWFKTPCTASIVKVALGIGLAMMTKLSAGLLAPGVALLFLWKWVEAFKQKNGAFKRLFWQFVLFGVLCVPLGLWWPMKNALTYHIPLTYVPALGQNSGQYLGDYSVTERLFSLPGESFRRIFMAWQNTDYASSYNEYNPLLALMKTAVFGEFTLFNPQLNPTAVHQTGNAAAMALFYSNAAIALYSVYAGIRCFVKKQFCGGPAQSIGLLVIWAVVLGSYLQFCFAYPQACTQNFRYAVPTLLCGCCFLGKGFEKGNLLPRLLLTMLIALFCFSSLCCYTLLGLAG